MNKISDTLKNKKVLIPFITVGDPNIAITEELIYEMEKAGADLIELGLPFSDPIAEGPIIQEASSRALANHTTTDKVFEMIQRVRKKSQVPLAIMGYVNMIYAYGTEIFMQKAKECGICCLIIPDVPFEEKDELQPFCTKYGIELVSLIAPTSCERIEKIASEAEGFLYCVSSMGVTGVRSEIKTDTASMVKQVRKVSSIPCAIGFGISTPEQAKEMAAISDGVIVGSAIMKIVAEYREHCVSHVSEYIREMKKSVLAASKI